jgi:hypothetical protein
MRLTIPIIAIFSLAVGCSFYNFFGYEENTGLHAIERPKGYGSAKFGAEIAATAAPNMDMMAVSAGQGHPTVFYQLSSGGDLVDVEDPWEQYLNKADEAVEVAAKRSGASLVGLPSFGSGLRGCVAIGEPGETKVVLKCESDNLKKEIVVDEEDFGHQLAAIRPLEGEPWLLAAAGLDTVRVCSDWANVQGNCSVEFAPELAGGWPAGEIYEIAGGLANDRFFVAATVFEEDTGAYRIYLFLQTEPHAKSVEQIACIERPGEPGFGGVMTTGDLNGDGIDELIASAAQVENRAQAVYVYDVAGLIPEDLDDPDLDATCAGGQPTPVAVLVPREGDLDVECGPDCGFGVSLAAGDIATDDGGPELAVGAPGATVGGTKQAGAVYVYRGTAVYAGSIGPAGQISDSSPKKGQWFGGGLAVAPMAGRNELVVGATGKGRVFIAFCTGVGENVEAGGDVTTNADGSVVSTRCRP